MPSQSVEAATRDEAIAAAREQFGPTARVVGVRRIRSGGMLGFFANERFIAEVEVPEKAPAAAPEEPPARTGAAARAERPAASMDDRMQELVELLGAAQQESPAVGLYGRSGAAAESPAAPVAPRRAGTAGPRTPSGGAARTGAPSSSRSSAPAGRTSAPQPAERRVTAAAAKRTATGAKPFTPARATLMLGADELVAAPAGPAEPAAEQASRPSPFAAALTRMVASNPVQDAADAAAQAAADTAAEAAAVEAAAAAQAAAVETAAAEAARAAAARIDAAAASAARAKAEAAAAEASRLKAHAAAAEAARVEAEAAAAEAARLEAEAVAAEAARVQAERAEAARIEAERLRAEAAEAARVEAQRVEAARIEAERLRAEAARIEAARIEAARLETARIEAEKAEAARIAAAEAEAARIEAERIAAAEAARIEAARVEAARIEAARIEAERIEAARIEAERIEAERIEAARLEAERIEAARLEAERIEAERIAAAAEAARIEAARIEAARIEAERIEAERIAAEAEAARVEAARVEAERIEAERIEAERIEAEAEAARIAAAEAEAARIEAARIEAERIEAERIEAERIEAERVEAERMAAATEAARPQAERPAAAAPLSMVESVRSADEELAALLEEVLAANGSGRGRHRLPEDHVDQAAAAEERVLEVPRPWAYETAAEPNAYDTGAYRTDAPFGSWSSAARVAQRAAQVAAAQNLVVDAVVVAETPVEEVRYVEPRSVEVPVPLARTASDPAPLPMDATMVLPPLSLMPPQRFAATGGLPPLLSSRPSVPPARRGRPPVPASRPALSSRSHTPTRPVPVQVPVAARAASAALPSGEGTGGRLATVTRLVPAVSSTSTALEPYTPNGAEELAVQLLTLGLPDFLLGPDFAADVAARGVYAALTRTLTERLPAPPRVPTGAGEVLMVVGPGAETFAAARSLALSLRLEPEDVQWAASGALAGLAPECSRITSLETAIERQQASTTTGSVTIVAVDAPLRTSGGPWLEHMLSVWSPSAVWAVLDSTRKPEDLVPWLEGLPRLDAVAVQDTDSTADPAAVLSHVSVPVALVDGARATAHRWASLLCERLEELDA